MLPTSSANDYGHDASLSTLARHHFGVADDDGEGFRSCGAQGCDTHRWCMDSYRFRVAVHVTLSHGAAHGTAVALPFHA